MIVYPPPLAMSRSQRPAAKGRTAAAASRRQMVQWKQTNVKQGVVIVDEAQLSKLIKREPIEKFYKLDPEPFATGLFASVRRCSSLETGEVLAAKFSSRIRYGEDCSAEIHHEIALLSLCSPSPRIVRLHDVFQTPQEIIIVMEFAPGGDMQTIIDDNLVPFESDVVKFVQHVVDGLAYIHHRKIAHLDIKPQNLVMMGDFPDCAIKVCDFEISRVILEGTEIREILGTPEYVAPEILHYEPITLAADMWSLGVTTYVLLTGFSPFGGETDQETFLNISRAQLDFPDELFEDVSEDAKDFIRRLLIRDPSKRMTAKECLRHKWLANNRKQQSSPPSSKPMPVSPRSETSTEPNRGRVGCPSCPPPVSANQKNLRKYLSKSREALFEKVVSQQKLHSQMQQRNENLRKSTLVSRYNKTRRLCESQMSLVSKSRERSLMLAENQGMSPSISRSREKLYGLRSLSKSHEVLNLCHLKTVLSSGEIDSPPTVLVEDILKNLTCDTTPDLSIIISNPTQPNSIASSTVSICERVKELDGKDDNEVPKNEWHTQDILEKSIMDSQSQPLSQLSVLSLTSNSNGERKIETTERDQDDNKENILLYEIKDEKLVGKDCQGKEKDEAREDEIKLEKIVYRPSPLLTQLSIVHSEDEPQSPEANADSLSLTEGNSTTDSDVSEEDACLTRISEFLNEDDEPRYTVAQLISAYNLHQEIVTKTSLEVTMSTDNPESKLLTEITIQNKFPTGPNALQLFIPNIDIGSRTKRTTRKKPIMRPAPTPSPKPDNVSTITEECERLEEGSGEKLISLDADQSLKNVELKPMHEDTSRTTPKYLRSGSVSSETSGASSSMSLEELAHNSADKRSKSNRSSGIASNEDTTDPWSKPGPAPNTRPTDRPNRKSFSSPRPSTTTNTVGDKTRRKSSPPTMKPFY